MNENILIQYVGFKVMPLSREYLFTVRDAGVVHEFRFSISNADFDSHRARYQDGPEICSLKLHRELEGRSDYPLDNHFRVSETELDTFRETRLPKSLRKPFTRKPEDHF
jgi:hypothetical protein